RMAAQNGAAVTPQAIEQRHTPQLVDFLRGLFERAVRVAVGSDKALAPLLDRFARVIVLDSTTINLPDGQVGAFPGSGGRGGFGRAAVKLQAEFDLLYGALAHVQVEAGRDNDGATSRQQARHGPGAPRIADPGYFNLGVFAAMMAAGEHFLS